MAKEAIDLLKKVVTKVNIDALQFIGKGLFYMKVKESLVFVHPFGQAQDTIDPPYTLSSYLTRNSHCQMLGVEFDFLHYGLVECQFGICRAGEVSDYQSVQDKVQLRYISHLLTHALQFHNENSDYEKLLLFTNKLYSSIDVEQVLQVVLDSIKELFVDYESQVWLSHDYEYDLPVKVLSFHSGEKSYNTKALITGETIRYEWNGKTALSAPMRGKQGVYGVIQLVKKSPTQVHDKVIRNLTMLADTAGTALENANLYRQSQRLVAQLQLINEASEQLSKTLNLENNIEFLLSKIESTFQPEGIYFLAFIKNQHLYKMIQTNNVNYRHKEFSIVPGTILYELHHSKEPCLTTTRREDQGCLVATEKEDIPYHSLMMVPMLHHRQVEGMIILTHTLPNRFSYDDYGLLQTLVHHASFAYVNSSLHEELNTLVITDNLTRLFTRDHLNQKIMSSLSKDSAGSLVLIDIDNFKKVNDSFGHHVGDHILIQVANIIKGSVRETDIAARWGGEELAIYLPNIPIVKAVEIANRIRERVANETSPKVTLSCGVSYWQLQDDQISLERLFHDADRSLYEAKGSGKDKVILCHKWS